MGRPRKQEPRDRQMNISLSASELDSIIRRAEAIGMRPVHFGRAALLDQNRKLTQSEPASNMAHMIHAQLVRLGNNLNQLARHCHTTGEPLPSDLEPLLKDIRQIIARVPK